MYISRRYPMTRDARMVVISRNVADSSVCWCEGRNSRNARQKEARDGFAVDCDDDCMDVAILHASPSSIVQHFFPPCRLPVKPLRRTFRPGKKTAMGDRR